MLFRSCLLPKFDRETVEAVVKALREGGGDAPPTGRILINPKEMTPNPAAPEKVWEKFVSLPSQTRPQRGAKPAIRLTALAHELHQMACYPARAARHTRPCTRCWTISLPSGNRNSPRSVPQ